MNNPFNDPGKTCGAVDADSRIQMVRNFDWLECEAALEVPGLQKTVEKAICTRMRKLERESKEAPF